MASQNPEEELPEPQPDLVLIGIDLNQRASAPTDESTHESQRERSRSRDAVREPMWEAHWEVKEIYDLHSPRPTHISGSSITDITFQHQLHRCFQNAMANDEWEWTGSYYVHPDDPCPDLVHDRLSIFICRNSQPIRAHIMWKHRGYVYPLSHEVIPDYVFHFVAIRRLYTIGHWRNRLPQEQYEEAIEVVRPLLAPRRD